MKGGVDGELVAAEDGSGGIFRWSGGEKRSSVDQSFMTKLCIADDYHGSCPHFQSVNGSVLLSELVGVFEKRFSRGSELKQIADNWPTRWPWRKIQSFRLGFAGG